MKLYKDFNISNNHKKSIILIGNFDGVHLGHQKLLKLAKSYKKKYNLKIGVINFDPMIHQNIPRPTIKTNNRSVCRKVGDITNTTNI